MHKIIFGSHKFNIVYLEQVPLCIQHIDRQKITLSKWDNSRKQYRILLNSSTKYRTRFRKTLLIMFLYNKKRPAIIRKTVRFQKMYSRINKNEILMLHRFHGTMPIGWSYHLSSDTSLSSGFSIKRTWINWKSNTTNLDMMKNLKKRSWNLIE